ncbi:MAG: DeoR/GlpR family DNA-binding transcription regulator [Anaerolineae bacterium]
MRADFLPVYFMKSNYLPEERRQHINEILIREGKVAVPDLAQRLGTSVDTIRRDLKDLEKSGLLTRVHGGALPRSPAANSYHTRQTQNRSAKQAIAIEAGKLIQPNQIVFMDGGTTALEVARHLPIDLEITIVTVSPPVIVAVSQYPYINAIMLGGTLDSASMTVVGGNTIDALSRMRADVCVLGVCSLHAELGLTTPRYEEARIKTQMINNSAEVIAVTTSDKFGTAAPFFVSNIEDVTHIVTEHSVTDEQVAPFVEAGIQVVRAKNEPYLNLNFR